MNSLRRLVQFGAVGGAGAGTYVCGSTYLVSVGWATWIASLVTYSALVPIVYLLQKAIVFQSLTSHSRAFPRYVASQLLGLIFAAAIPYTLAFAHIAAGLSFVVVVCFVAIFGFTIQSKWVF